MRHNNFTGSATEYRVAAYFLDQGFQVYWPSMQQCRADMVIDHTDGLLKVQVKKATWSRSGPNEYLSTRLKSRRKDGQRYVEGDWDLLAVWDDDRRLWLVPWSACPLLTSITLDERGPTSGTRNRKNYNPDNWRVK